MGIHECDEGFKFLSGSGIIWYKGVCTDSP